MEAETPASTAQQRCEEGDQARAGADAAKEADAPTADQVELINRDEAVAA